MGKPLRERERESESERAKDLEVVVYSFLET